MSKKKLLVVTSQLRRGGAQIMACNLLKYLDPERYDRTCYVVDSTVGEMVEEVEGYGVKVIAKPEHVRGYLAEYRFAKDLMRRGGYEIVHAHLFYYNGLLMRAAAAAGVPKRLAHGHMTQWIKKETLPVRAYYALMGCWLRRYTTVPVACSPQAGARLFGETFFAEHGVVVNNGVDLAARAFCPETRSRVRTAMGVSDRLVIGHVGNLYAVKNQMFILEVFSRLLKKRPEAVLWLIGEGEQENDLRRRIGELGLEGRAFLLGVRTDVPDLMQAMDALIFPSLFEGVPLVPVEAQGSGLPCLLSDRVTDSIHYNPNVAALPLEAPPEQWADKLEALLQQGRCPVSEQLLWDYDLPAVTKRLEAIYER